MNKKIRFGLLHVQSLFSHVCIQKFNLFPVNSMAELPQMKKISPCLTGNDLKGPISQPMLNCAQPKPDMSGIYIRYVTLYF